MFWFMLAGSMFAGIGFAAEYACYGVDLEVVLVFLAFAIGGFIVAFLSNPGLYAVGELVENSTKPVRLNEQNRINGNF